MEGGPWTPALDAPRGHRQAQQTNVSPLSVSLKSGCPTFSPTDLTG